MRGLIILVCLLLCGLPGIAGADLLLAERAKAAPRHIFQSGSKARISNQQAASKAKRHYPGNKILSVKMIRSGGPAVYRIKMLSEQGVVKLVFVDGNNGEVFE